MRTKDGVQRLAVDLRFRPNADAAHWQGIFDSLARWEPRLQPFEWFEASDPSQRRQPWSAEAASGLFQRCANHVAMARIVEGAQDDTGAITVRVRKAEIVMLIALPHPPVALDTYFKRLLEHLQPDFLPAVGMMFDLDAGHDAEVIFQGLRGLHQVPPYFYLDAAAVNVVGREKLQTAPATVLDMPGGGLLLVSRPDPWARRIGDELRRARAVEQHLGISVQTPLVLAG